MAVTGIDDFCAMIVQQESRIEKAVEAASAEIGALWLGYERAETPWKDDRPHTRSTFKITLEIEDASILIKFSADMDAELWLEFFHGGQWASIYSTLDSHKAEFIGIELRYLSPWGFVCSGIAIARNPMATSEAIEAAETLRTLREHSVRIH